MKWKIDFEDEVLNMYGISASEKVISPLVHLNLDIFK